MKRRLFIAFNLPEELKDAVEREVEKIRYQFTDDVRFINRDNWHVTVTFLGSQEDHMIPPILDGLHAATEKFESPEIEFSDISYGPKKTSPTMIWLNGSIKSSKELQPLKDFLEDALVDNRVVFKREHRQLSIHITLARLMTAENLPELSIPFSRTFFPETLDLMESRQAGGGVEYEFLQKMPFKL